MQKRLKPSGDGFVRSQIYAEQVRQLFVNARTAVVATFVNSTVLAYMLWQMVPHRTILLWLAAIFVVTLLRTLHVNEYLQRSVPPEDASDWGVWFTFGLAVSGLIWGSAGVFLFSADSVTHEVFLAFVLGGMVAGAAGTYSVLISSFLAFALPALVPLTIRFFLLADEVHIAAGGMIVLYFVLILSVALRVNAVTASTLKLRFDNLNLVAVLASEKEEAERLNRELLLEIAEREKAEQELSTHRTNLEERVQARTAELSDANLRLKREIQARTEAENSLRASEEHFRSLIEHGLDLITEIDSTGMIVFESSSVERLLGYRPAGLIGRDVFEFIHPDDRLHAREALARIMREPGSTEALTLRVRHQNSSWRTLETKAKSIRNSSGTPRIIINSRDVTENTRSAEDTGR